MGFRGRVVTWSITGLIQHAVLFGLALALAIVLAGAVAIAAGWAAARIALPIVDRAADRSWAEALAPLSSVPERYPVSETNDAAMTLERIAASQEIWLDAVGDSRPLAKPARPIARERFAEMVDLLTGTAGPVWAMDVSDCVGAPATSERGHIQLQRLLLATGQRALADGRPAESARLLEASWQLNAPLLRSPHLATHVTACSIVEQEMALLRGLPSPEGYWRVRLAALDIERHALEAYRFEAWRVRCLAGRYLSDIHPLLGAVAHPAARLLAHQHHDAMLFAVRELPSRDIRSFDPDAFVAEQHARVPRTNPIARAALPRDWTSWPASVRTALDVELALRVLELRSRSSADLARDGLALEPRQPSRVAGVDWLYEVTPDRVTITVDSSGWAAMARRPLQAAVPLGRGGQRERGP